MSGYIGNVPTPQATQSRDSFTATAGQTSFATSGYSAGGQFLDVHLNGVKLQDTEDYTATNGSDVVLTVGAAAGDTLEVVSFSTFEVADVYTRAEADAEFVSDPNGAVTVDGSGNVGIGTAPAAPLDVGGNIHARGVSYPAFKFANSSGTALAEIYYGVGSTDLNVVSNQAGGSIRLQAAGAERMRIDDAGRVTMPYQPAFKAGMNASTFPTGVSSTQIIYNFTHFDRGGHYNTSTGRYTVPVTGLYAFTHNTSARAVYSGTFEVKLFQNGVERHRQFAFGNGFGHGVVATAILSCAQGDYIDARGYWGTAGITLSGDLDAGATGVATLSYFSGYLVG